MLEIKRFSILIGALFFGTLPIFIRNIQMAPLQITFFRVLFAVPFLTFLMILLKEKFSTDDFKFILLLGFSNIGCMVGYITALKMIEVATAGLLLYMAPIYVIPLSVLLLREKFEINVIPTIAVAFVGLILLLSVYSFKFNTGIIYGIISGVSLALIFVIAKRVRKNMSAFKIVYYQMLISTIILSPIIVTINFSKIEWSLLAGLGLIPTALAYAFYFYGMKFCRAFEASILALFEPVFVILFAYILLEEALKPLQIIGGILILSSIILSRIAQSKRIRGFNFFRL